MVDYFLSYRAAVRAKVAALAARDAGIPAAQREAAAQSVRRHLELAAAALESRERPVVVLVSGVVGTGKSSAAAELADRLDAVVIASDRVRKRLQGVEPTQRLSEGWGSGAYSPEQTARVYEALLERARPVLASGRCAVLDATFSRRAQREAARGLAEELGLRAFAVEVRCAEEVARERLARRMAAGTDPSDAGPDAYAPSVAGFEPLDEWEPQRRAVLATDAEDWRQGVSGLVRRIRDREGAAP